MEHTPLCRHDGCEESLEIYQSSRRGVMWTDVLQDLLRKASVVMLLEVGITREQTGDERHERGCPDATIEEFLAVAQCIQRLGQAALISPCHIDSSALAK